MYTLEWAVVQPRPLRIEHQISCSGQLEEVVVHVQRLLNGRGRCPVFRLRTLGIEAILNKATTIELMFARTPRPVLIWPGPMGPNQVGQARTDPTT